VKLVLAEIQRKQYEILAKTGLKTFLAEKSEQKQRKESENRLGN